MIRTKLQAKIAIRVVNMPGCTAKQIAQGCSCILDTVYRMIKAGDLVSIRRRVYDPSHKFTVAEVQAIAYQGRRPLKPAEVKISGDPLTQLDTRDGCGIVPRMIESNDAHLLHPAPRAPRNDMGT